VSALLRLAVGWATLFVLGTDLFVVSPLLPAVAASYAVPVAAAAWSVTVFSLAYMLGAPALGHLADRFGRRRMVTSGLAVFAAANLLTALAPGFFWLLAARLLAGLAAAAVAPALYAIIGGAAPAERRGTWLAIAISGLLVALSTGAPLGTLAAAAYGWPSVFLALAGAALAALAANRLAWPADMPREQAAADGMLTPAVLAVRLAPTVAWATALYGVYTYLGAGLAALGISAEGLARALMLYGLGALVGSLAGGRLADRLGTKTTATVSLLGLSASLIGLRLVLQPGLGVALVLGLASALAQLFFPAQQSALARDFPARRAAMLAWNNSALYLGISLGSLWGGAAFAARGFAMIPLVAAALALLGWALVHWTMPGVRWRPVAESE
jgi:predicted MFS family arabinose efflux permease